MKYSDRKSEVWVTIIGEQTDDDGGRDKNAMQCRASLEREGDVYHLEYDEIDEDGKLMSHADLRLSEEAVTLVRDGELRSMMEFRAGEETASRYLTPFGEIPMSVRTKRISLLAGGERVHSRIFYDLVIEGAGTRKSILIIKTEPI